MESRGSRRDRETVAWLAKLVTNLCLNRLRSARVQRGQYVGPWLPEPVLTSDGARGPLETAEQRDLVSLGLLLLPERLTRAERSVSAGGRLLGVLVLDIADGQVRALRAIANPENLRFVGGRPPACHIPGGCPVPHR